MFAEVRLRTGIDWSNYIVLQRVSGLTFDTKYKDLGAISFSLTQSDAEKYGVGDGSVIEIAPNGVNLDNMWFGIDGTSGTKVSDGVLWKGFSGKSIASWLGDGLVYPSTWPNVPTTDPNGTTSPVIQGHSFLSATPGNILRTLIARCKERGTAPFHTLSWLDEGSFTGTTTSDGVAWATTLTTTYSTGTSVLQVLQDLVARNLIEFKMVGMALCVFNYGSQNTHYTPEQVTFFKGRNVVEQNSNTDSSNAGSVVLIQGDESAIVEVTDPVLLSSIGRRREKFVSQGGITDIPTLTLLGNAELAISGHILSEESLGVRDTGVLPWFDYKPGDWIWEDVAGTLSNLQIQQISAGLNDNNTLTVGLTLGDMLDDAAEKMQRRIDNITGQNAGSYGGLPNSTQDFLSPSPPSNVFALPTAYRDINGVDFCQVSVTWAPPTTNIDGTPVTDLDRYEVQYKLDASPWSTITSVPAGSPVIAAFFSGLQPGKAFTSQVRAVDTDGNASTWVPQANSIPALPHVTIIPPAPSTPTVTQAIHGINIGWDGLDNTNTAYDSSWARTTVWVSSVGSAFQPGDPGSFMADSFNTRGGFKNVINLTYATNYWVKLRAVDKSGNLSPLSAPSTAVQPGQLSDPDLPDKLVTGAKIADGTINTAQLTVATFGDSVTPNGGFEDPATDLVNDTSGAAHWRTAFPTGITPTVSRSTVTGDSATGISCLSVLQSGIGTVNAVNSDNIPIGLGDVWYVAFKAKASRAGVSTVDASLYTAYDTAHVLSVGDPNNPQLSLVTSTLLTTSYQLFEGQVLIPSGLFQPLKLARLALQINSPTDGNAVTVFIDDVTLAPVRGSAYIKDASIVNAKINNVSADKITAGTITADLSLAARIKTADSGARVELSDEGISSFDDNEVQTFNVDSSDGSVTMTGDLTASSLSTGSIGASSMTGSKISDCDYIFDEDGGRILVYGISTPTITTITATGTGTYIVPPGITSLKVEAWGAGGGGGGGAPVGTRGGAGGAGGEYARENTYTVTPGDEIDYTVGAGGVGAAAHGQIGGNGGTTVFGGSTGVVAHGGRGCTNNNLVPGATGSTNNIHFNGGANGIIKNLAQGGGGGGGSAGTMQSGNPGHSGGVSGLGGTAVSGGGTGGNGGLNAGGTDATAPGAGGGGGGGASGGHNGGDGARGQIRISYSATRVLINSLSVSPGVDDYGLTYPAGFFGPDQNYRLVGVAPNPNFGNSWSNYGAPQEVGFIKDATGRVHLVGVAKNGTLNTVFILPVGYRPLKSHVFVMSSNSTGTVRIDVNADGTVVPVAYGSGGNNASICFSGINFLAGF